MFSRFCYFGLLLATLRALALRASLSQQHYWDDRFAVVLWSGTGDIGFVTGVSIVVSLLLQTLSPICCSVAPSCWCEVAAGTISASSHDGVGAIGQAAPELFCHR